MSSLRIDPSAAEVGFFSTSVKREGEVAWELVTTIPSKHILASGLAHAPSTRKRVRMQPRLLCFIVGPTFLLSRIESMLASNPRTSFRLGRMCKMTAPAKVKSIKLRNCREAHRIASLHGRAGSCMHSTSANRSELPNQSRCLPKTCKEQARFSV
jgi:hypothetical protein